MFTKHLIDLILKGKKTMTSRDKPLYKVSEVTNLMANRDYSKISGKYVKITKVYPKTLGEFTYIDANKEGFNTLSEFKHYWKKNIGEWDNSITVWVHEFQLITK